FEIPTFLEIDKFVLALTYRGCKPVCSFCKQQGHWKSDCPELEKFKQNKLKNTKKNSKSNQNTVGLAPKSAMETKLKTMFADINKKINQEAQKKYKEPEEHTIKSMQKKIDNFFGKSTKKEQKIILGEVHNEIAPQVKAIKDSTKPTKLQSLELNNKNKDIKQSKGSNLELLYQPIYADSSYLFTPNFIKVWDKSDENYTENNVSVAIIDMDLVNELADNNGINDAEMQTNPTILCLQETHTKTGSELMIATQNSLVWAISELRNEYSWMSVKVNPKTASGEEYEIIVVNIRTPHVVQKKK
ncbi:hypothetical protein BB561_002623, partial [Smittium simulii]